MIYHFDLIIVKNSHSYFSQRGTTIVDTLVPVGFSLPEAEAQRATKGTQILRFKLVIRYRAERPRLDAMLGILRTLCTLVTKPLIYPLFLYIEGLK